MKGIGASSGIVIGRVAVLHENELVLKKIRVTNVEQEISRLMDAIGEVKREIENLITDTEERLGHSQAKIFEAHLLILEDPMLLEPVIGKIEGRINAEWAIKEVLEDLTTELSVIDNEYIKERVIDIKDVITRVIRNLLNIKEKNMMKFNDDVVIVAKELTPSLIALLSKTSVKGFITEDGSINSHTVIMARALGMPTIVGAENIQNTAAEDDNIILDGYTGKYYINPDKHVIDEYTIKIEIIKEKEEQNKDLIGIDTVTKDGWKTKLRCNIGFQEELTFAVKNDAEGIGLFRSEYLFMNRDSEPSEVEQLEAYKRIVQAMKGKEVIIRTLDVGGDKQIPYLNTMWEENPFLGERGIRYCLGNKKLFKTQLRALLQASIYGNLSVMFPMITNVDEVREAKLLLEEAKAELKDEKIGFNKIKVGIMIEVPAAALISDILAKEVDFFSIGTNDLIQYTMAVDRMNEKVSHLYNSYHPALLRLIKLIIDNGHKENISVSMCGEAAGDLKLVPIFVGMGLDEFSMNPSSILPVRRLINSIDKKEMEAHVPKILGLSDSEEVLKYLTELEKNL